MKKIISLILSILLLLVNFQPVAYAAETQNEMSDIDYATEVMAEILEINKILEPLGINLGDLQKLPQKDSAFYEGLKEYLITSSKSSSTTDRSSISSQPSVTSATDWEKVFEDPEKPKLSAESKNDASLWAYAWEMASLNQKRDYNAKDLIQETKYMFMSHYVDIKTGPSFIVDKSISDDVYFSAWITNDDRNTYDTYLKHTRNSDKVFEFTKGVVSMYNSRKWLKEIDELTQITTVRSFLKKIVDIIKEIDGSVEEMRDRIKLVASLLNEENNPKAFVDNLKNNLSNANYDKMATDNMNDALCAMLVAVGIGSGGIGDIFSSMGISALVFYPYMIKDLYDKVWFVSLIQYNGLRVGNRMLRAYGF
ncbi:hypothetical protein [Streptococcus oricebi]|uniref:Uncharacterized protein n=1 Tax=Streptococcus oricebi TaxID=1547447 RepID=A0ABS5B320_9STRE|nr:hypothetical protein [Streptococcus oricebi]MBP2623165.1 hypothetical protein [Streptococcus oricebi]